MTLQELAALYTTPSVLLYLSLFWRQIIKTSIIRLCLLLFWDYSGDTTAHAMRVCCILYMHGTIFGRQKKQNVLECGNKYKRTCVCRCRRLFRSRSKKRSTAVLCAQAENVELVAGETAVLPTRPASPTEAAGAQRSPHGRHRARPSALDARHCQAGWLHLAAR